MLTLDQVEPPLIDSATWPPSHACHRTVAEGACSPSQPPTHESSTRFQVAPPLTQLLPPFVVLSRLPLTQVAQAVLADTAATPAHAMPVSVTMFHELPLVVRCAPPHQSTAHAAFGSPGATSTAEI